MRKVIEQLVDDLDGSEATKTVTFSLDGMTYEIDLNDGNALELEGAFATYIRHGRRVGRTAGNQSTGNRKPARTDRELTNAIREWGRSHGYAVSERGRISTELQKAYDEAH